MHACLPPHCDRPLLTAVSVPDGSAAQQAKNLLTLLQEKAIGAAELAEAFFALHRTLAAQAAHLSRVAPRLSIGPTATSQAITLAVARERESDRLLETYRIYDEQFAIRRLDKMTGMEMAGQALATWSLTLADLPGTLLSRENYRSLIAALWDVLTFAAPYQSQAEVDNSVKEQFGLGPLDRWQNGHHLFGICCYFCREHLARAIAEIAEEKVDSAAQSILSAALHLEASSATLAYTTDFPARFYLQDIRPGMPEGFSGSQNSDFNHLKMIKGKLHAALFEKYARQKEALPPVLLQATSHFRAIDLLDVEQHVLVAAARVGLGASLKQELEQQPDLSAIEGLRSLSAARRRDFDF